MILKEKILKFKKKWKNEEKESIDMIKGINNPNLSGFKQLVRNKKNRV